MTPLGRLRGGRGFQEEGWVVRYRSVGRGMTRGRRGNREVGMRVAGENWREAEL